MSSRMQRCPHALVNPSRQDGSTQRCQDFLPRRRRVFPPELGATLEVPSRSALGTDLSRRAGRHPLRAARAARSPRCPQPAPPAARAARAVRSARAARATRSSPIAPPSSPCLLLCTA